MSKLLTCYTTFKWNSVEATGNGLRRSSVELFVMEMYVRVYALQIKCLNEELWLDKCVAREYQ